MLAKAVVRYPQRLLDRSYRPDKWIAVDSGVRALWMPTLAPRFIPDGDIVIATAWKTAEWVARYPKAKGRKFYFIQGYEEWDVTRGRLEATWLLPLSKIVIARWLQKKAEQLGEKASYVPNAIDHEYFFLETAVQDRKAQSVAMLYHKHRWKGAEDGIRALVTVKSLIPDLRAELFGIPPRPDELPKWIQYHQNPSQAELREIYNRSALFLAPSYSEGWGLTALEAMACGAALVATDNGGHLEFAVDGENALLVSPGDWNSMAENLKRLVIDPELRIALSSQGVKKVKGFNWPSSLKRFENALFGET